MFEAGGGGYGGLRGDGSQDGQNGQDGNVGAVWFVYDTYCTPMSMQYSVFLWPPSKKAWLIPGTYPSWLEPQEAEYQIANSCIEGGWHYPVPAADGKTPIFDLNSAPCIWNQVGPIHYCILKDTFRVCDASEIFCHMTKMSGKSISSSFITFESGSPFYKVTFNRSSYQLACSTRVDSVATKTSPLKSRVYIYVIQLDSCAIADSVIRRIAENVPYSSGTCADSLYRIGMRFPGADAMVQFWPYPQLIIHPDSTPLTGRDSCGIQACGIGNGYHSSCPGGDCPSHGPRRRNKPAAQFEGWTIYQETASGEPYLNVNVPHEKMIALTAYPNPTNNEVNLTFNLEEAGEINVKIFDATGREIFIKKLSGKFGFNLITLDVQLLKAGNYMIEVSDKNLRRGSTKIAIVR